MLNKEAHDKSDEHTIRFGTDLNDPLKSKLPPVHHIHPPPDTAWRPRNALVYGYPFTHELIDLRYEHREKAGPSTIRPDTYFASLSFFLSDLVGVLYPEREWSSWVELL